MDRCGARTRGVRRAGGSRVAHNTHRHPSRHGLVRKFSTAAARAAASPGGLHLPLRVAETRSRRSSQCHLGDGYLTARFPLRRSASPVRYTLQGRSSWRRPSPVGGRRRPA